MNRLSRALGAFGLLTVSGGFAAASAATAAATVTTGGQVATAQPFAKMLNRAFGAAPTTAQCEQQLAIACYSPNQIETAYDMPSLYAQGLTGKGKTIVLVDSFGSPTIGTDLKHFDATFHLPAPPSFTVIQPAGPVPPFDPNNSDMVGWAEETSLDVEYSHAMAPGANLVLVETPVSETEGVTGFPQIVQAENYIIQHHIGDVISQSFGATEQTFPNAASIMNLRSAFVAAQAHNVTVLASSGDDGSTDAKLNGVDLYTHRVTSWPASDPLVTSVGGTQLHLAANGTRIPGNPDNVWNDTNYLGSPAATGGGQSIIFSRPAYQNGVASVVGMSRGVPDLSLSAAVDGGVLVYLGFQPLAPAFYVFGGTSEASPLLSGVVAIADQAAGHDLGLLNSKLYSNSSKPGLPDVEIGNNTVTFFQGTTDHTVPGWTAEPGYDLASGLGTVDGAKLVHALAAS